MKYQFKIRFNTKYEQTDGLYWRVLINEQEHLFAEVIIRNKEVRTISHVLPGGERKWSMYCESDDFQIQDNSTLIIQ